MKLSQFSFFGTPIKVKEQFEESTDQTYMLVFTKGTEPGIGVRSMTFVTPTAASTNIRVDARPGGGFSMFPPISPPPPRSPFPSRDHG